MGGVIFRSIRRLRNPRTAAILFFAALILWWPGTRLYYYWWVTNYGPYPERGTDLSLLSKVLPPEGASLDAVYQGLPHHHGDKDELFRVLFTRRTREIGGYRFYSEPMPSAPNGTSERMTTGFRNPELYEPYSKGKSCYGFHPNYCYVWKASDGALFYLLICTGCGEAIIIGDGNEVQCDVNNRLLELLLSPAKQ